MNVENYNIDNNGCGRHIIFYYSTLITWLGTFHNGQGTFLCFDFNLSIDGSLTNIVEGSIPNVLPFKGFRT